MHALNRNLIALAFGAALLSPAAFRAERQGPVGGGHAGQPAPPAQSEPDRRPTR